MSKNKKLNSRRVNLKGREIYKRVQAPRKGKGMNKKSFKYKRRTFTPFANTSASFLVLSKATYFPNSLAISKKDGYTHDDFYKVAKAHDAEADIYEVKGEGGYFIPATYGIHRINLQEILNLIEYC